MAGRRFQVLDMHKGRWQLKRHPANTASVYFWDKVIDEYTNGNYEVIRACPGAMYDDGTLGDVFSLKIRKRVLYAFDEHDILLF